MWADFQTRWFQCRLDWNFCRFSLLQSIYILLHILWVPTFLGSIKPPGKKDTGVSSSSPGPCVSACVWSWEEIIPDPRCWLWPAMAWLSHFVTSFYPFCTLHSSENHLMRSVRGTKKGAQEIFRPVVGNLSSKAISFCQMEMRSDMFWQEGDFKRWLDNAAFVEGQEVATDFCIHSVVVWKTCAPYIFRKGVPSKIWRL